MLQQRCCSPTFRTGMNIFNVHCNTCNMKSHVQFVALQCNEFHGLSKRCELRPQSAPLRRNSRFNARVSVLMLAKHFQSHLESGYSWSL